jgi:hypothetical protein
MTSVDKPTSGEREPVITRAAATIVTTLIVDAVVAFGLPVSPEVQVLILGIVTLLGPAVLAIFARLKTWSPASVTELIDELTKAAAADPTVPDPGSGASVESPTGFTGPADPTASTENFRRGRHLPPNSR